MQWIGLGELIKMGFDFENFLRIIKKEGCALTNSLILTSAVVVICLSFGACATASAEKDLVAKRAPFDLNCDESKIEYSEIGNETFGAAGCGRKASYIVECGRRLDIGGCKAILNSDLHK